MEPSLQSIESYDQAAADLCARYEGLATEQVHARMLDLFPSRSAALDIGSGSGRDAVWLAGRGNLVVAAEPSAGMLREARRAHGESKVVWLQDCLPGLASVRSLNVWFDFVLLSACWMHVHPADRPEAFASVAGLLASGGTCVITLRHGTPDPARAMHRVSADEIRHLAAHAGLSVVREVADDADRLGRADVHWSSIALRA